jgi:GTP-binding protein YchF
MKIGIVGFPGAGKSTVFNALTGLAEEGPTGRNRERIGVIKVPDRRVDRLAELSQSKKKVYAEITFIDVAGRPEGAPSGKGLDPAVIQAMRECEALVVVLRAFDNPMLNAPPDPAGELDRFREELILSDLIPLETRRERLKKEAGKEAEKALVQRCLDRLESGQPLAGLELSAEDRKTLAGFALISLKPLLALLNQDEAGFTRGIPEPLRAKAEAEGVALMALSGKIEMEIATLDKSEQGEFLKALGIAEPARDRFIRACYAMLDLISFLTTGEDESRAWPIKRGTPAVKAAGRIHSDIERGFIRAELVAYDDLIAAGGEKKAREKGTLRLEGKQYIVQDGDVINFRFNV